MSAGLAPEEIADIISSIASVPVVDTPELDDLSGEAAMVDVQSDYAYGEGFQLAQWLRQRLDVVPGARILVSRFRPDRGPF